LPPSILEAFRTGPIKFFLVVVVKLFKKYEPSSIVYTILSMQSEE
jgi:hypothetical protein